MRALQTDASVSTVLYHVLIMLIAWPVFAWIYFKKPKQRKLAVQSEKTLGLAFFWLAAAVIVDLVDFVLIKSPYSLTPHGFYVIYQPWTSLAYMAIFLSPLIRLCFSRLTIKG
jgi:hypothetical protein